MLISKLQQALKENTLPQVVADFTAKGLRFNSVVDATSGDTLLHWLWQHAPLEYLYQERYSYQPYFFLKNYIGETCLTQAIKQKRQSIIYCLLFIDQGNFFQPSEQQNPSLAFEPLDYKSIFAFKKAFLAAKSIKERCNLIDGISKFQVLTVPVDKHDNSFIHFVCQNGELSDIDYMLKILLPDQINHRNNQGQTPLIQATIACRQNLASLLLYYGADVTIHDHYLQCAEYYSQQAAKPTAFIPYNILPLLDPFDELKNIHKIEDLQKLLDYLDSNWLSLSTLVNRNDNTILHYLVLSCPLNLYPQLLARVTKDMLLLVNSRGETPLHTLIRSKFYVKANALIHHGADAQQKDFSGLTAIAYAQSYPFQFTGRSAASYLYALKLMDDLILNVNWRSIVKELIHKGFRLDEPIDTDNNSIMSYLSDKIPYKHFQWILDTALDLQLDFENRNGITLLMTCIKNSRFVIARLVHEKLIQHNYNYTLPEISEVADYKRYLQRTKFPTVFDYFISIFSKNEIKALPQNDKIMTCYRLFLLYIRKGYLTYNGTKRDGTNFLDREYCQPYTVNCYDLAAAFGYLLISIGFENVKIHHYRNIKSRPFNNKGNIYGDFICFDQVYHNKNYANSGGYVFNDHYVLEVEKRYFDPTFCCYYDNESDVLAPTAVINKENLHTTTITINYNLEACASKSPFNITFLAALNKILVMQQFTMLQQGGMLLINGQDQFIQLQHRNQTLTAFAKIYYLII